MTPVVCGPAPRRQVASRRRARKIEEEDGGSAGARSMRRAWVRAPWRAPDRAPAPSPRRSPSQPRRPSRRPASRSRRHRPPFYGALDLGTNNCRLLVADAARPRLPRRRCLLAHRAARRGHRRRAAASARRRWTAPSRRSRSAATSSPTATSPRARLIATEACRARRQRRRLRRRGCATRPASASRSSRARPRRGSRSPAAPRWSIRHAGGVILFDIGGGSSELVWIDLAGRPTAAAGGWPTASANWVSLPVGVVNAQRAPWRPRRRRRAMFEAMVDEVTRDARRLPRRRRARRGRRGRRRPHARHLGHGDDARRRPPRPAALRPPPGRRHLADRRRRSRDLVDAARRHGLRGARAPIPASAASAPIWCSPAAPSSRRSAGAGRASACASPTAACAKACWSS